MCFQASLHNCLLISQFLKFCTEVFPRGNISTRLNYVFVFQIQVITKNSLLG